MVWQRSCAAAIIAMTAMVAETAALTTPGPGRDPFGRVHQHPDRTDGQ